MAKIAKSGQWMWAKQLKGAGSHAITALGIDGPDNILLAGMIGLGGSTQPVTMTFDSLSVTASSKNPDGFVMKLDAKGKGLWVRRIGSCTKQVGCLGESIFDLAIDDKDTVYVAGLTGNGFALDSLTAKKADGSFFVLRLNTNGKGLSVFQANGSNVEGYGIAINFQRSILVTGLFQTGTFGTTQLKSAGNLDFFVWKIP